MKHLKLTLFLLLLILLDALTWAAVALVFWGVWLLVAAGEGL